MLHRVTYDLHMQQAKNKKLNAKPAAATDTVTEGAMSAASSALLGAVWGQMRMGAGSLKARYRHYLHRKRNPCTLHRYTSAALMNTEIIR